MIFACLIICLLTCTTKVQMDRSDKVYQESLSKIQDLSNNIFWPRAAVMESNHKRDKREFLFQTWKETLVQKLLSLLIP